MRPILRTGGGGGGRGTITGRLTSIVSFSLLIIKCQHLLSANKTL